MGEDERGTMGFSGGLEALYRSIGVKVMKKIQQAVWAMVAAAAVALVVGPVQARSLSGSGSADETVNAGAAVRYVRTFSGGERAIVMVEGDGSFEVRVYDQAGNFVASDGDTDGQCVVDWVPASTQKYTIRVVNRENRDRHFALHVN
jgi:hypothetical protein